VQITHHMSACLLSLPVLPPGKIVQAVSNIRPEIADDGQLRGRFEEVGRVH